MKGLIIKMLFAGLGLAAITTGSATSAAETAICYNCPVEWADWGSQIKAIKDDTGITVPPDNKNSGQSIAQMMAEKKSPMADVTYLGITAGVEAVDKDLLTPYKPKNSDDVPDNLKDKDGKWTTIHFGTIGFMVNVYALEDKK